MVVNKDGIIEYYRPCTTLPLSDQFTRNVLGRHLLDVYPELNESNSTVMRTLQTGKVTVGEKQELSV